MTERKVFYVDVGNMSMDEAEDFLCKMTGKARTNKLYWRIVSIGLIIIIAISIGNVILKIYTLS